MSRLVGVRFDNNAKIYTFFCDEEIDVKIGDNVIVDTINGQEYAEVVDNNLELKVENTDDIKNVVRRATYSDTKKYNDNKLKSKEAIKICLKHINKHGLDMKLIDAKYNFDNSKLTFRFSSIERVDFRELVKDLARIFRTRIELRQVGARDRAKLVGALGICGQETCCSRWKNNFEPVSINMAKNQNLSLNSLKISGMCGKLKCCLKYEDDVYTQLKKEVPVNKGIVVLNGEKKEILEIDIFKKQIKIKEYIDDECYKEVWVDYPKKCCEKREVSVN